jgi:transcriptional regulator GlxA family with amidase domain
MLAHDTGKSFMQIRNEFRLNNIELMLNTTRLSVKELADEYGFTNTTHFYKLYKEHFKKYPRESA